MRAARVLNFGLTKNDNMVLYIYYERFKTLARKKLRECKREI